MYLEKETFKTVIDSTPLVSIDLVVKNSKGNYLLGFRNNSPAQGYWFVPGGRILKNETMDDAFTRLCQQELGISLTRDKAKFLGPFEHFYADCVFNDNATTHYVVLGYEIYVDLEIENLPTDQHQLYQWVTPQQFLSDDDIHIHSKWYVNR